MAFKQVLICILPLALALPGCSRRPHHAKWIDPAKAVSPVMIGNDLCVDLSRLPQGWKVSSDTVQGGARFGIPGATSQEKTEDPPFKIIASAGGGGLDDYREYAEQWLKPEADQPRERRPDWDVNGFQAHPADDGEIVYVSRSLDALMECGIEFGCTIHDGLVRKPIPLNFRIAWSERSEAAQDLALVRRTLSTISKPCDVRKSQGNQ